MGAPVAFDDSADELEGDNRADPEEEQQRPELRRVEIEFARCRRDPGDPARTDESGDGEER